MSENLTVGQLIRERRIAQALSLGQLASKLGVPPASVRAWERGDDELPPKIAPSLAEVLGLDESTLVPPPEPEPEEAEPIIAEAAVAPPTEAPAGSATETAADAETVPVVAAADVPVIGQAVEEVEQAVEEPGAEAADVESAAIPEASTAGDDSAGDDTSQADTDAIVDDTDEDLVDDSLPVVAAADADLVDLPTEVIEPPVPIEEAVTAVIEPPVSIEEATTQVVDADAPPSVDDLASTEAVEALLAGAPTTYGTTTTGAVVGAPVAVIAEKPPYWKDPNQRWRYWVRAVATVAVLGVFLYVLGWALGELSEAFGGFLDQFSDAGDTDPLDR